jgi:hypothetical protein
MKDSDLKKVMYGILDALALIPHDAVSKIRHIKASRNNREFRFGLLCDSILFDGLLETEGELPKNVYEIFSRARTKRPLKTTSKKEGSL